MPFIKNVNNLARHHTAITFATNYLIRINAEIIPETPPLAVYLPGGTISFTNPTTFTVTLPEREDEKKEVKKYIKLTCTVEDTTVEMKKEKKKVKFTTNEIKMIVHEALVQLNIDHDYNVEQITD